ncbi:MAG: amidase, partial [Variovorax sp.]
MTDIWRLSASRVADLIAQRKLSAVEAAQAALARLDAVNPQLNAVVQHRPDAVLARAAAIDAALARGEQPGPLAGVPVTVKVNIDQAGFATTNGVALQKDWVATSNSPVVDNLEKAGAVIVGRTNTPAFSYRWFTSNSLHGRTLNPRDAALTPGGSSGGAASAVAAGIGHIGHGTDIAGSIRYPAYACGVHGLRPSLGRVAAFNASSPERTVGGQVTAVSGPIARSVHDLRLALAAMAAPDARDPWWVPAPLVGPAVPRTVALCVRPDGLDTQPEVVAALHDAADRLRDAGWTVDELD